MPSLRIQSTPEALASQPRDEMKGSSRSLWLSAANRATGYWTSAAVAVLGSSALPSVKAVIGNKPKRKPARRSLGR